MGAREDGREDGRGDEEGKLQRREETPFLELGDESIFLGLWSPVSHDIGGSIFEIPD
jgi:hypothetical protein